jgi:beta-glucosidase
MVRRVQQIAAAEGSGLPILFGLDNVHGGNYVKDSVIFPHQIGLAATFDPSHAEAAGSAAAKSSRAAALPWIFSPILGIAYHPLWPRFYETFGEDPYLAGTLGSALIRGIQQPGLVTDGEPLRCAASMKHLFAYPATISGEDRAPIVMGEREVREMFLPAFAAAARQPSPPLTAMESYIEIDGIPIVSSGEYLGGGGVLRAEMGFEGVLVTDFEEIRNLVTFHKAASDIPEAILLSLSQTTIDMSMVPNSGDFTEVLVSLVKSGALPEERLDASVRRILALKEAVGIMDEPIPSETSALDPTEGVEAAEAAVLSSLTLLKNEGEVLPLSSETAGGNILLTGPSCDSLAMLSGGWTVHWQGAKDEEIWGGYTIVAGVQEEVESFRGTANSLVTGIDGEAIPNDVLQAAESADAIVVCIGESPYAEKQGDGLDLSLPAFQVDLVVALAGRKPPTTPLILILVEGRPRLLGESADVADAIIHAYLPGPWAGRPIAKILFGTESPSGRLPFTYPLTSGGVPYHYHHKPSQLCQYAPCDVQWPFGAGLSYTTFEHSPLSLDKTSADEKDVLELSATVRNAGNRAGAESLLLFSFTPYQHGVTPNYKRLRRFEKVYLEPGESREVKWAVEVSELNYIGTELAAIAPEGPILFALGPDIDCRADPVPDACASVDIRRSDNYNPGCEASCYLLLGCQPKQIGLPPEDPPFSSQEECMSACQDENWGWGYFACLRGAARTGGNGCAFVQMCGNILLQAPWNENPPSEPFGRAVLILAAAILGVVFVSAALAAVVRRRRNPAGGPPGPAQRGAGSRYERLSTARDVELPGVE